LMAIGYPTVKRGSLQPLSFILTNSHPLYSWGFEPPPVKNFAASDGRIPSIPL
jgi:hypothetical protein